MEIKAEINEEGAEHREATCQTCGSVTMTPPFMEVPQTCPSLTVYINNLNEKIRKNELKKSLYTLFSQFGQILNILSQSLKMRAQHLSSSKRTAAPGPCAPCRRPFLQQTHAPPYANTDSDIIAEMKGTFVEQD
ncbi:U1 small nuclear ribonucleoprotein A [Myotis davidii]|uniref:U1 small nuclear ribonucleoprotein A n=1 Tax=Myotis davidii TaxID=225400 RepID=L5MIT4_MYODS|nr:U1 small nuclear ribonucleoprotein A [Myotis davidii]